MRTYLVFLLITISLPSFGQLIEAISIGNRHEVVTALDFSPDGRLLASTNSKHQINLWETTQYHLVRTFKGHRDKVLTIHFNPSGSQLVTGSSDQTVKVWDVATGDLLRTIAAHDGSVTAVQFSTDGRWIASGGTDRQVKLWEAATGKPVVTLSGHRGTITSLEFSPDGRFLISGSSDKTIRLWSLAGQKLYKILRGHHGWVRAVKASPDSLHLVSCADDHKILIWEIAGESKTAPVNKIKKSHTNRIVSLDYHPGGRYILSGGHDNRIALINTAAPVAYWENTAADSAIIVESRNRFNQSVGSNYVSMVAFNPSSYQIAAGTLGKGLYVIDYYQRIFKISHSVEILQINHKKFNNNASGFETNLPQLTLKGTISRAKFISKVYMVCSFPDNTAPQEIEIGVGRKGKFSTQIHLQPGENLIEIRVIDQDPQINQSVTQFKFTRL